MVGTLCPTIGQFLVLRRLSMVGDTLAHVSLAGVLIGLFLKVSPLPVALIITSLIALFLERLRQFFSHFGELSLAIILSTGMGFAVILLGITNTSDASMTSLLFGSIITLTNQDMLLVFFLFLLTSFLIIRYYRELFFLTFDEEAARLKGISVRFFNSLLILLAALVIILGLKIVGSLLVSSLMVIPVATSLVLERSFKQTLLWSNLFGLTAVLVGLLTSFYLDIAPGGAIVITAVSLFLIVLLLCKIKKSIHTF